MGKHNLENKRETINKMKNDIENTERNYREDEKTLNQISDEEVKADLQLKNFRREHALNNMKSNIQNEYDKENNFKNNMK
ncbi:MAG TPA: hypothetical protein DEF04_06345 [Clostridiales bacterium]|nr:hypothetical protein [Clostridiales bacterium]